MIVIILKYLVIVMSSEKSLAYKINNIVVGVIGGTLGAAIGFLVGGTSGLIYTSNSPTTPDQVYIGSAIVIVPIIAGGLIGGEMLINVNQWYCKAIQ